MRRRKLRGLLLAVLVSAAFGVIGCTSGGVPDDPPSIRGVITTAQPSAQGRSVRIVWTEDEVVGPQAEYDAAQVTVTQDTKVFRQVDQKATPASFEDLRVGDVVYAWFTGPVAESYPVQAGASHVLIVGRYAGKLPEPPGLQAPIE